MHTWHISMPNHLPAKFPYSAEWIKDLHLLKTNTSIHYSSKDYKLLHKKLTVLKFNEMLQICKRGIKITEPVKTILILVKCIDCSMVQLKLCQIDRTNVVYISHSPVCFKFVVLLKATFERNKFKIIRK